MREVTETVELKEVKTKHIKITCDICKREAKKGSWNEGGVYEINETEIEVTVRQKEGTNYPEGGQGFEMVVDLCPVCFKEKLVPWLESQGAVIEEKPWDW